MLVKSQPSVAGRAGGAKRLSTFTATRTRPSEPLVRRTLSARVGEMRGFSDGPAHVRLLTGFPKLSVKENTPGFPGERGAPSLPRHPLT